MIPEWKFKRHMSKRANVIDYIENNIVKYMHQNILVFYIGSFLLITAFAYFILMRFPNSADEYAYIFQSMTFHDGKLWNNTHPLQEFFSYIHILQHEGKWVSRFPPGYPIVIAVANFLNIPSWLVNPIVSSFVLWIFFTLTKKIHGVTVATIATLSLLSSSYFIMNGASFFSHMLALLFILLFFYFSVLFLDTGHYRYAVLAGFWIGFAFITRPYSAVLIAIPLLLYFLLKQPKRTMIGAIYIILGATPLLAFLFYYNYEITGDPFTMVTQWLDKDETIGFVKGHTWERAVRYTIWHLNDMLFWSSPFLVFILVYNIFYFRNNNGDPNHSWIILELFVFIIIIVGYALYYAYGGNQYGPRFYFEGYPFAVIAVTALIFKTNETPNKRIYISKALYIIGLLIAVTLIPFHSWKENKIINERMDLYRLSEHRKFDNSIIIISSGTGVIRPMPPGNLTRNGISIDNNSRLYVIDLGSESYRKLRKFFPNRNIYRYVREKKSPSGEIIALPQIQ